MSEKWDGFTTEEILNIGNPKVSQIQESSCLAKKATFKQNRFSRKNMTRERMLKTVDKHCQIDGEIQGLPKEANLFIPQIPEEEEEEGSNETSLPCQEVPFNGTSTPPVPYASLCEESDVNISPLEPYFLSKESGTECNINKKCSPLSSSSLLLTPNDKSLDEFEKRQNMIKEQNRQRKELLKKALEDRTKKTQEESRRLSQIEDELKKLDIQLSNDVSILRNQIELASLEFMETQKRFDHAEQEYLDAKLALFTKRERKELLTSHLCTIIEQNELRKAKKLSDLMDKLQLGSVLIEKPMERPDHKSSQESTEQTTVSNKIQKVNNATT